MIKILIVEDEKLTRQGLRLTFDWTKLGCEVIGDAVNGEEGETKICMLHPDIVITDIKMPIEDGLQMMKNLQGKFSGEYIILSGFDEFSYAKQAIELGARGYLLKPVDDRELEETLQRAIREIDRKRREAGNVEREREEKDKRVLSGFSDKYISRACDIIRCRYKEEITAKAVAEELNISDSYLEKLFKSKTSYTFHNFLTFYRMKAAIELLENSDMKVYHIAYEIGYNDAKYFSKTFQKIVGIKPTEYRKGYHLAENSIINSL